MTFVCMICKGQSAELCQMKDAKDGQPIEIALCDCCGHLQLAKVPDPQELRAFYSTEYRKAYRKADAPKPRHVFRAGRNARARLGRILQHVAKGTRTLDIGAGGGEFVYLGNRAGLSITGIDPASGYLDHARTHYAVELRGIGMDDLARDERYGLITLFHVLEHLPDPVAAIAKIADHLEDGGLLYLEVPDLCARDTSPSNLWFKAHLSYFTEATLRLLVENRFEVLEAASGRVLEMILQKRPVLQPIADLPARQIEAVALSRRRMHEKTFGEYLLHGGLTSPIVSIIRIVQEMRGTWGRTPDKILDTFTV